MNIHVVLTTNQVSYRQRKGYVEESDKKAYAVLPASVSAERRVRWKNGEQDAIQHILVIEDDLTLAQLETEVLSAHGYTVIFEPHGERAISLLQQALPDLVVLDLELVGDVHGWEVLRALRSHANIPVLITSSSATTARHYRRMSGETRATLDHLAKPYPIETLLKRVKRMLPTSPTQ